MTDAAAPSVLVPYPGLGDDPEAQDVFVYLRPESNGVLVESTMLRVIQKDPNFKRRIFLVYLANLPGAFIARNHTIEEHYSLKLRFAVHGGKLFTPGMREGFFRLFGVPFDEKRVVGSFEALKLFRLQPEELFGLWVPEEDFQQLCGQTIKKIHSLYVVNYDIPAILHKNNRNTDIAVMIFRTTLDYPAFDLIVEGMQKALLEAKILSPGMPLSRVFHYSKGPFEQILDGTGYVYDSEGRHIPLENLAFSRYLADRGVPPAILKGVFRNPLFLFPEESGTPTEDSLYIRTAEKSYAEAFSIFRSAVAQVLIP